MHRASQDESNENNNNNNYINNNDNHNNHNNDKHNNDISGSSSSSSNSNNAGGDIDLPYTIENDGKNTNKTTLKTLGINDSSVDGDKNCNNRISKRMSLGVNYLVKSAQFGCIVRGPFYPSTVPSTPYSSSSSSLLSSLIQLSLLLSLLSPLLLLIWLFGLPVM